MEYLVVDTISEIKKLIKTLNDKKSLSPEDKSKNYNDEVEFLNKSIIISEYKIVCRKIKMSGIPKENLEARLKFVESELRTVYIERQKLYDLYYDESSHHDFTIEELKIDRTELDARIDALEYARLKYFACVNDVNLT